MLHIRERRKQLRTFDDFPSVFRPIPGWIPSCTEHLLEFDNFKLPSIVLIWVNFPTTTIANQLVFEFSLATVFGRKLEILVHSRLPIGILFESNANSQRLEQNADPIPFWAVFITAPANQPTAMAHGTRERMLANFCEEQMIHITKYVSTFIWGIIAGKMNSNQEGGCP